MIIWVVLEWTCQLMLVRFQLAKQTLFGIFQLFQKHKRNRLYKKQPNPI